MKIHKVNSPLLKSALTAIALSTPLHAIERPTPALQPEEKGVGKAIPLNIPVPNQANAENAVKAQVQEVAYLGVFGEAVSETLSTHLNLAEGTGLQLKLVAGDSPAAKANLQKHDILLNVAGKDIHSQNDLRESIRDNNPGDVVELKYISRGEVVTKQLTLGSRPLINAAQEQLPQPNKQLPAELGDLGLPKAFLDKFPAEDREKLMKLIQGRLEGLDLQELQNGLGKLEGFDLNLLPKGLNPDINKGLKFQGGFRNRFKMLDNDGSITLESNNDGKIIELLDKEGELQYRGPYNTEADKKNIPKNLRDRVERLDIDNGLGMLEKPAIDNLKRDNMKFKFQRPRAFNGIHDLEKQFMERLPKELQNLDFAIPQRRANGANEIKFKFSSNNNYSTTQTDPQTGNRYTFQKDNKLSQIDVYDRAGKHLYGGPYNTDADKASVPNEYRDFIQKLEKGSTTMNGNKLKFNLGQ